MPLSLLVFAAACEQILGFPDEQPARPGGGSTTTTTATSSSAGTGGGGVTLSTSSGSTGSGGGGGSGGSAASSSSGSGGGSGGSGGAGGAATSSSSSTTSSSSSTTSSSSSTTSSSSSTTSSSSSTTSSTGGTGSPGTCPGEAISIAVGTPQMVSGNTNGASDKFTADAPGVGNCTSLTVPGPDLVYAVTPTTSGKLTASLSSSYAVPLVRISTACPGSASNLLACQYITGTGTVTTIQVTVTAGTTYYVVADSANNNSGAFTLTLTLQ